MNKSGKSCNGYFIAILILLFATFAISLMGEKDDSYTKAELVNDLKEGNVSQAVIQPNNEDLTWIISIITIMNGVELSLRCWNSVSEQVIPTVKVGLQLRISRAKVNGLPRLPLQLNVNKGAVLGIINKPY